MGCPEQYVLPPSVMVGGMPTRLLPYSCLVQGRRDCVDLVARSGLDVFAHNVETVGRAGGLVAASGWSARGRRSRPKHGRKEGCSRGTGWYTSAAMCGQAIADQLAPTPASCPQVERLQGVVRDRRAGWAQSLGVLVAAKEAGALGPHRALSIGMQS